MTQDQSDQVEDLLIAWHRYQDAYSMPLGGARCSPMFREYRIGDQWLSPRERSELADQKVWKMQSELVDACVDALGWEHRAAIQISMKNKRCGADVWSNARISKEESHLKYQEAKEFLFPRFLSKGLIKAEIVETYEF